MRVSDVEVRRLSLPLAEPFATAMGTVSERELTVVRLGSDAGEGWGECAALAAPTYTEEYADGAFQVLVQHLAPRLVDGAAIDPAGIDVLLAPVRGHRMAKAALEMAVLDADLRQRGVSLARWLGGVRTAVPAGVVIGMGRSVDDVVGEAERRLEEGYRRLKVKIRPGWDLAPLRAVRQAVGGGVDLVADANATYGPADVADLARLDEIGLVALEQPLAEEDLQGHAALARRLGTPICLDESITSAEAARRALELGACAVVSVKPGRLGGVVAARSVLQACLEHGASAWVGGMLEAGIGRAAALAVAALPGFSASADLSASSRYYRTDLVAGVVLDGDGCLAVPQGPGLGVTVDDAVVDAHTVRRALVER